MSAKEMLEKLGYDMYSYSQCIEYVNWETDKHIWFYLGAKTIEVQFDIEILLLQAINQQVKELGWLDE